MLPRGEKCRLGESKPFNMPHVHAKKTCSAAPNVQIALPGDQLRGLA
jgi:hypothetical protein